MTDWTTVFLAVIAAATGVMALIQVGVIIYGARLANRVNRLADRVEREFDPVMGRVHDISAEASRATKIATAQVERADQLMAHLSQRADETFDLAQHALIVPARKGLAIIDALRAAFSSARAEPPARDPHPDATDEDDEALFVG